MPIAFLYRLLAIMLIVPVALLGVPQTATAATIGTQTVLALEAHERQLDRVSAMLAQEEVREAMIQLGVDPDEAQERVRALSEQELSQVEQHLDSLPAGGNTILVILGIVFLVLLILELTGAIDIFKKV